MKLPSGEKSGCTIVVRVVGQGDGQPSGRSLQPEIELSFACWVRREYHHRPIARQRRLRGVRGIRRDASESWSERRRAWSCLSSPTAHHEHGGERGDARKRDGSSNQPTSRPARSTATLRREAPRRPRRHPARVGRPRYREASGCDFCQGIAGAAAACSSVLRGGSTDQSGSRSRMAAMLSGTVARANAVRPVSIS